MGSLRGIRGSMRLFPLLMAAVMLLALSVVGCSLGSDDADTTTTIAGEADTTLPTSDSTPTTLPATTATTSGRGSDTVTVKAYFSQNEVMTPVSRTVPYTLATARAAMEELLRGPNDDEQARGLFSAIPAGTKLLDVSIANKVATVDLSAEFESGGGSLAMFTRLAQVVFTLTQFPSVDSVVFKLEGTKVDLFSGEGIILEDPQTRADWESMSPAILVESPTQGEVVDSPLRAKGTANTFEGTFIINIVDWDGLIIAEKIVTATSGSGTRGTFDVTVPFTVTQPGWGALIVFTQSPMDGSQQDVVEIPLRLE